MYVEVDDLDATLKKAESLGGKTVMPPMAAVAAYPCGYGDGLQKLRFLPEREGIPRSSAIPRGT